MGTLKTTIILQDKFSDQLNKINKSIQNTANAMSRINGTNAQSVKSVNSALSQQIAQNNTILKQMGQWATRLRNISTLYFAIRGGVEAINRVTNLSDRMTMNTARLGLMADSKNSVNALESKSFAAAMRARSDYLDFNKAVTKLGILAGDKFANQDSIIRFTELMQKQFAVGGADASERSAAMLQLTQAIASNRLQGDELRSIRENAPLLVKAIQDSLGVTEAKFKDMAKAGEITADVIIKAMANSAGEVEKMFNKLPLTWEHVWTRMKNVGYLAFKPIQQQLSRLFNSQKFLKFIVSIQNAMIILGNVVGWAFKTMFDGIGKFIDFVSRASGTLNTLKNAILAVAFAWGIYKGIQLVVIALTKMQLAWTTLVTAAQWTYAWVVTIATTAMNLFRNATTIATVVTAIFEAILGNLAVIIGVVIVAALAVLIYWILKTSENWIDAISRMVGGLYYLWEIVKNVAKGVGNVFVNLVNGLGTLFNNLWSSIQQGFWSLLSSIVSGVKWLLEKVNINGALDEQIAKVGSVALNFDSKAFNAKQGWKNLKWENKWEYGDLDSAYNKGYSASEKFLTSVSDKIGNLTKVDLDISKAQLDALNGINNGVGDMSDQLGDVAGNTGDTAKNTASAYEQDYSYLRNWAYQSGLGNSIGYNIKIEQNNKNNIGSNMDLNRVVDAVRDAIIEGITVQAEGVR